MTASDTVTTKLAFMRRIIIVALARIHPRRHSLRAAMVAEEPGFTLVAVASLAIGIGFNTALFAVVDALLFKPLPVAAPERLVDVFTSDSTGSVTFSTSSYPDYLDLKAQNEVFDGDRRLQPDVRGAQPRQPVAAGDGRDRHRQLLPSLRRRAPRSAARSCPKTTCRRRRAWRWCRIATGRASSASAPDAVGRSDPHPRQSLHDRRRRAGRLQRHGAGAVAGDVDSGVRVARGRAGRDARHRAVADGHDAARSPRRSVAVHAGAA